MTEEAEKLWEKVSKIEEILGDFQLNVYNRLQAYDVNFDGIDEQFNHQTQQRIAQSHTINAKLDSLQTWADNHAAEEKEDAQRREAMLKDIVESIEALKTQTMDNTFYLDKQKREDEIAERIEEDRVKRSIMIGKIGDVALKTVVAFIIGGVSIGLWNLALLAIELSDKGVQ